MAGVLQPVPVHPGLRRSGAAAQIRRRAPGRDGGAGRGVARLGLRESSRTVSLHADDGDKHGHGDSSLGGPHHRCEALRGPEPSADETRDVSARTGRRLTSRGRRLSYGWICRGCLHIGSWEVRRHDHYLFNTGDKPGKANTDADADGIC